MNWIDLDTVRAAWTGDLEPLARELEQGHSLTEEAAEFLTMYLRGEVKWRRGNRRTFSQMQKDMEVLMAVSSFQWSENISFERALHRYCEEFGANYETVRSATKRAKNADEVLHPKATTE